MSEILSRHLSPIERCRCGRAAAFCLHTVYRVSARYSRSASVRERIVPICGVCAEAKVPGASETRFPHKPTFDQTVLPIHDVTPLSRQEGLR
ncbi:MAG: hypothetical protein KGL39_55210 [Patescibacteria group bacterium]|nr:hypothetical protein [Patescibacteria group bacterium]